MYVLWLTLVMFLPGWSADAPKEKTILLVNEERSVYETKQECINDLKILYPTVGVYHHIYPEDSSLNIGLQLECRKTEDI